MKIFQATVRSARRQHASPRRSIVSVVALVVLAVGCWARHADAQADAPVDARPRLNANDGPIGSVDRFEVDSDSLQRGSFALPMRITLPMQRAAALINLFPTYSPASGYSEWGKGWASATFALIRRGRHGAPRFNDTDTLESQWGLLSPGLEGHYPLGFQGEPVVARVASDTVTVLEPNGTRWTYGGAGGVVAVPGRGAVVWMLANVENLEGDRVTVDQYETSDSVPNGPTPGPPGRFFPKNVSWHRWETRSMPSVDDASGFFEGLSSLARRALQVFSDDAPAANKEVTERSDVVVATATYSYERVPEERDDFSLGVLREIDRRVAKITFALRDRQTDAFRNGATYTAHYDPSSFWLLTGVDEVRGGETQTRRYSYGGMRVRDDAPLELKLVDYARAFPSYPAIASPAHAITPGELMLHLTPADFDADGVADFIGRKATWFTYSEDFDDRYVQRFPTDHNSKRDERCVGLRAAPQVIYARPGSTTPILAAFVRSPATPREVSMVQCALDGTLLDERKLALLGLPDDPDCKLPLGPETDSAGEVRAVVTDVTSDALPDVVMFDRCAIQVWSATASKRELLELEGCDAATCRARTVPVALLDPTSAHSMFDVNGDGLPDIVARSGMSWLGRGIDASRMLTLGSPDGTLSTDLNGDPNCGFGPSVFADLNNDEYVDQVQVCPSSASLTVAIGSRRGLKVVSDVGLPFLAEVTAIQAAPLGGMPNPGIALIGTAKRRNSAAAACPAGTRAGNPDSETFLCSPEVQWLTLQHADTGLLTEVDDGRGSHLSFKYDWSRQAPGFPERRSVLEELRSAPTGEPERFEHFSYDAPWRDADTGQRGFLRVRRDEWSSAAPNKKTEIDLDYQREGRLSWLTRRTVTSPSGLTVEQNNYDRSVAFIRSVPAVRLDAETLAMAHTTTGVPAGSQVGMVRLSRRAFTYDAARPHCVSTITVLSGSNGADKLVTTSRRFAEPKLLSGALSCLATEVEVSGTHADATLDFKQLHVSTFNDAGMLTRSQRKQGDQVLDIRSLEYEPQNGLLHAAVEPGREPIIFAYEPAAKTLPNAPKTRLVRSETTRATVPTSVLRSYEPVRDLLIQTDTRSGAHSLAEGVSYDDWGRPAAQWRSDSGGAQHPWHTLRYTPRSAKQPSRVDEVVRLNEQSARHTIAFLDSAGETRAALTEWERGGGNSLWRLLEFNDKDATRGTARKLRGGFYVLRPIDQLLDKDIAALGDEPAPRYVRTEDEDFQDDDFKGTRTEYIGPMPPPPATSPPPTERAWHYDAQLSPSGQITRRARSSTPHCDPQQAICSLVFSASTLDGLGREVSVLGRDGRTTRTDYDMLGRIRRIHLPSGRTVAYDYDGFGRLASMTRESLTVRYRYDGTLLSAVETRPSQEPGAFETLSVTRTNFGNVKSKLFTRGDCASGCEKERVVWDFQPKAKGTPEISPIPTGAHGRGFARRLIRTLDTIAKDEISLAPQYDPENEASYSEAPWRRIAKTYARFADSSVESVTTEVFNGKAQTPKWRLEQKTVRDATGRLAEVWIDGKKFLTVKHEAGSTGFALADGRAVNFTHSDALRTVDGIFASEPDVSGNPTGGTKGLWAAVEQRNVDGQSAAIFVLDNDGAREFAFKYGGDQLAQLTEKGTTTRQESYAYDTDGLLKTTILSDGSQREIIREPGRIGIVKGANWTLDAFGRPLATEGRRFNWSPRGQIQSVVNGAETTSYFYDENDQRVLAQTKAGTAQSLEATIDNVVVTDQEVRYDLYVAGRLLGTFVGDGKTFMASNYDRQNTLWGRAGERAPLVTAYGVRGGNAPRGLVPEFVGRRFDTHTGMLRLGVRDYIAELGQFASPDPAFLASAELCRRNPSSCNLFGYARGNPIVFADPSGLLESNKTGCDDNGDCGVADTIVVTLDIPPESRLPQGDSSRPAEAPRGDRRPRKDGEGAHPDTSNRRGTASVGLGVTAGFGLALSLDIALVASIKGQTRIALAVGYGAGGAGLSAGVTMSASNAADIEDTGGEGYQITPARGIGRWAVGAFGGSNYQGVNASYGPSLWIVPVGLETRTLLIPLPENRRHLLGGGF